MFSFRMSSSRSVHLRALHVVPNDAGVVAYDADVRRSAYRLCPDSAFAPVYVRPRDPRLTDLGIAQYASTPLGADEFYTESHLIVAWSIRTAGRTLREAVLAGLSGVRWEDHAVDHSEWLSAWFTAPSNPSA